MENKIEKYNHKDVVITRKEGELVVTSRQIAEDFDKDHRVVVRAIENKAMSLTEQNCSVEKLFIPTTYNHNGNEYKEYLLTKDGFTFIVMGFTGAKADAWKLKYIEAFNKMEQALREPQKELTPIEMMELQFSIIKEHDRRLEEVDEKINAITNSMTIDHGQQEVINRIAKERLVQVLGGKDTPAYRELSKKVFSNFWKTYRLAFHVGSYKDTSKKNYEEAIKYIKSWEPSKELGYMITGANSQLQFNN